MIVKQPEFIYLFFFTGVFMQGPKRQRSSASDPYLAANLKKLLNVMFSYLNMCAQLLCESET